MKKEDLQKIKEWLPRGYAGIVSKKTGVSKVMVYKVIAGTYNNLTVLDALIKLAKEHKSKIEIQEKIISTL